MDSKNLLWGRFRLQVLGKLLASPPGDCQSLRPEIESLSATYGLGILQHSFNIIGDDLKPCLSFLLDHARIDVVHTQFNRKTMSQFLAAHPETTDILIQAGIKALSTYGNFVSDCWDRARK